MSNTLPDTLLPELRSLKYSFKNVFTHTLLMDNNVFYLVAGRQGGIILCHWPTKYKYIEINYISRFLVDDIVKSTQIIWSCMNFV